MESATQGKGGAVSSEVAFSFEVGEPLANEQHELFCLEYLARNHSAVRAYLAAYPDTKYQSAASAGSRLLKSVEIQDRIKALHREQVERLKATADRVLLETGKLAYTNMRDLFDASGKMIPIHELDPEVAAAIIHIEVEEVWSGTGEHRKVIGQNVKVKLADKYKGLELLGKRLKVFSDNLNVNVKHTLEDLVGGDE